MQTYENIFACNLDRNMSLKQFISLKFHNMSKTVCVRVANTFTSESSFKTIDEQQHDSYIEILCN